MWIVSRFNLNMGKGKPSVPAGTPVDYPDDLAEKLVKSGKAVIIINFKGVEKDDSPKHETEIVYPEIGVGEQESDDVQD